MSIKVKHNFDEFKKTIDAKKAQIEKAIEQGIQEVSGPETVKEEYNKSGLRVRSGRLNNSFEEENTPTSKTVSSETPYARIHDQGGLTGRNYRTQIKPTYYFTNATKSMKEKILARIRQLLNR